MIWKFQVVAAEQRRLFSRILQILESQMVVVHSFAGETNGLGTFLAFVVTSEEDKAHRIEAMLHRLQDVHSVSVLRGA